MCVCLCVCVCGGGGVCMYVCVNSYRLLGDYVMIQYNTTLLSVCREICFPARHLHKNIQYS